MRTATYDVLVIGAGPAGLAAAVEAAEHGRAVGLVDAERGGGGQIWRAAARGGAPERAAHWIRRMTRAGVIWHGEATVVDSTPGDVFAETPHGLLRLRADATILATGATERFLPFPGWTLPGVMGAGGAQAMVKAGLDVDGKRVVVAGSGPLLLEVAAFMRRQGADVAGVFEQARRSAVRAFGMRLLGAPAKLRQALLLLRELKGVRREQDAWTVRADGTERLESVTVRTRRGEESIPCDLLACGFGLVPALELPLALGCATRGDAVAVDARQLTSIPGVYAAGELTGIGGVDKALVEGRIAGLAAAGAEAEARDLLRERRRHARFAAELGRTFALRDDLHDLADDATIVCRCEDVPLGAIRGAHDGRDAKLQSRCGMGPCQGRVCGPALEALFGWRRGTVRPPYHPVTMETLAALGEATAADTREGPTS